MQEGFIVKCLKCGREIRLPDDSDQSWFEDKEGLTLWVSVYGTIEISCVCGNKRE